MEQEPTKQPAKSWTAAAFDRVNNEWVHTMNHSYDHAQEVDPEQFIRQAPPMRITPSRRTQPISDWQERLVGIGDIHFPFQNKKRLALAQLALREVMPDTIVLMGDNLDYSNYSRWGTREEWAGSTQRGIDEYAEFLGQLRSDHPEAKIIWHEGNHDLRMEKMLRNYNGDLLGIRRAGEALGALSLEFLVRAEELDVQVNRGYPAERELHKGVLETHHGHVTNSTGLAASKIIRTATTSFMTGHTHQLGVVSRTFDLRGEETTIYGAEAGTYADQNLIPSGSYAPGQRQRNNWQSGIPYWLLDEEMAVPTLFPIDDSSVTIFNRRYQS